jgi:uridine kinase
VENKRINLLFNLVVIFFLALTIILIRELNANRAIDYKEYFVTLSKIVKQKNNKIREMYSQLVEEKRENADLKNTLAETRNVLDALSKKLGQPAPAAVPAVKS